MPDEQQTRLLTTMETELADVELALARLEAGTYARCEVCEGVIDESTRAGNAAARRCAACSTAS